MDYIIYDNKYIYIKKNRDELNNEYYNRIWFIVKNIEKCYTQDQVQELISYSNIWIQNKIHETEYDEEIHKEINELEKKFSVYSK